MFFNSPEHTVKSSGNAKHIFKSQNEFFFLEAEYAQFILTSALKNILRTTFNHSFYHMI